jgi:dihydrolipoamide dehydrogenase
MKSLHVDVAILGSGTAGMTAYRAARAHGKRVLLIENHLYGTTCARVGCMPSKLLIAAAEAAHAVAAAPAFGIFPGPARIDGRGVMARVRSERDRFVGFVQEAIDTIPAEDKLHGHARFTGPTRLQVGEHTVVEAERFVIATGSTPIVPQEWREFASHAGGDGPGLIISDRVFDWTDLPASVAVVGTGVIGLELGQALHRLGVRVRFYARGASIAQLSDPLVLQDAARCLSAELDLRLQTQIAAIVRQEDGQLLVSGRDADGNEHAAAFEYVLVAIGRSPNVRHIGLETTGLVLDRRGVPLYDKSTMQCGHSAIFIAGDADDERPVLPEAADQGRIAGDNAGTYPDVRPGLRRTPLAVAFCEPQIATVGARHQDLCRSHAGRFAIGAVSFDNQGRSRVMLQNRGLLRVYGEFGSGRFLGAEMVGPRAEHLGHLLAWACQAGLTVAQMLDMPFYHPVVEEGVRTALRELAANLSRDPAPAPCADCSPGV